MGEHVRISIKRQRSCLDPEIRQSPGTGDDGTRSLLRRQIPMNDFRTIRPDLYLVYDAPLVDRIYSIITSIIESPGWDSITIDDMTATVREDMKQRNIVVLHPEPIIMAIMDYYTDINEIDQLTMDSPRCLEAVKRILWPYVARIKGSERLDLGVMAAAITDNLASHDDISSAMITRELTDHPAFSGLSELDINDMVNAVFFYFSDMGLIEER